MRVFYPRQIFGRPSRHHSAALLAALGTQIQHEIGGFDHVQIVLNDEHAMTGLHQQVQHLEQTLNIGQMQAGLWVHPSGTGCDRPGDG